MTEPTVDSPAAQRDPCAAQLEEALVDLLEVCGVGATIVDRATGTIFFANTALADFFGVARQHLIGRRATEFYTRPAERPVAVERLADTSIVHEFVLEYRHASGASIWGKVRARIAHFRGRACNVAWITPTTPPGERDVDDDAGANPQTGAPDWRREREHFVTHMTAEIPRARNAGEGLHVMLFAIDGLAQEGHTPPASDVYGVMGHAVCAAARVTLAGEFCAAFGRDRVGVVVRRGEPAPAAAFLAERIRTQVLASVQAQRSLSLRVRGGVATLRGGPDTALLLFRRAERALELALLRGNDQIVEAS